MIKLHIPVYPNFFLLLMPVKNVNNFCFDFTVLADGAEPWQIFLSRLCYSSDGQFNPFS